MKSLRVSSAMFLPLTIIVVVALLLSVLYGLKGEKLQMAIVMALVLPLLFILLGWWRRRLTWNDNSIEYRGFLSTKRIPWEKITEVRFFRAGMKKVLYIGSREDVLFIPLIFSHQDELAQALQKLPLEESVSPSTLRLSWVETLILWTGALLLIIIFITKVF
jgi:hypothetical protein